jgi:hypothetical protein
MRTHGELRYSPTILNIGTRWRRVFLFTPGPLYPQGNSPRYPLDRRLDGPQSLSWHSCHHKAWQRSVTAQTCNFRDCKVEAKLSYNRPWRSVGLRDFEAPTFFRQSAHRWRWSCQPYVPAAIYPQQDSWYSYLLEAEWTPGPQCGWKD